MDITKSLFEGELISMAPIDRESDAAIESGWTHDPEFLSMVDTGLVRPLAPPQLKKKYETIEKEMEEGKSLFYFTIRSRADKRLVGFAEISRVDWSNGNGLVKLGIGDRNDRGQGYGTEALRLILHYAFAEMNLYRLTALVQEYNVIAQKWLRKVGFREEARQRQAINRSGKRWDLIRLSLLKREWESA
jgi:RimJ/RimL family protein N-acetyltransferase